MNLSVQGLRDYNAEDRLRDGRRVRVRAIRPDDKAVLQEGLHRLSTESVYYRFFRPKKDLSPEELIYFTEVDFENHVGLIADLIEDGAAHAVGVGRYIVCERQPVLMAELAFAVDDAYHGLGVATTLLRHLIQIARAAQVAAFRATVLEENRKMLEVLHHAGLPCTQTWRDGAVEVRLALDEDGT